MKERPILFSTPMVQAILEGRKTQTRRVIKAPHVKFWKGRPNEWRAGLCFHGMAHFNNGPSRQPFCYDFSIPCPYGQPGDRLWVRESARVINVRGGTREIDIEYQADKTFATVPYPARLAPAPRGKLLANGTYREASRILLEIDSVRVERLNDISEEDAKAEGVWFNDGKGFFYPSPVRAFESLWESINSPGSWDVNPWVWVVEFKRVEA